MVKNLLIITSAVCFVALIVIITLLIIRGRQRRAGQYRSLKVLIASLVLTIAGLATASYYLYLNLNSPMTQNTNPFFEEWSNPYGAPPFDKIRVEHYMPAFEHGMQTQNQLIDSIVTNPEKASFENTIEALDRSGEKLRLVENLFFLQCAANTSPELQIIEAEISPILSTHYDNISLNDSLFLRIKAVHNNRASLNKAQQRLTELYYKRFVRNGAMLPSEQKLELQRVNQELSTLEVKFSNNVLAATNDYHLLLAYHDLENLPTTLITAAERKARELGHKSGYAITLDASSLIPFLTNSPREDLRKELYTAYLNRCAAGTPYDNTEVINEIIRLRLRKAKLLGYDSYASFVLDDVMAKKPENVYDLLDDLWEPALKKAEEELEALRAEKFKDIAKAQTEQKKRQSATEENVAEEESYFEDIPSEADKEEEARKRAEDSIATKKTEFNSWDWWYYAERVKRSRYSFDEEAIRPYLSLSNVRQGVFELSNRLYGVTFRPLNVPVYHSDCQTYEVLDRDNTHLGIIYLDYYARSNKEGGAWCGEYRSQSYTPDGRKISPIITVVYNFARPADKAEALLSIDETLTFFHEFGHALHNLFKDVPYEGLTDVERDFVEMPSQLLENWAFETDLLKRYATHIHTGEILPDRLLRRYRHSQKFNKAFPIVELIAAAYIDLDIHNITEYSNKIDLSAYEEYMLRNKRGLIPQIEPRYRYPYFRHAFSGGYDAAYYSYLWSEVLDKDAFQAFVETGDIFNRKVANRLRTTILSQGGMKDGMELYVDFRDTIPSRTPMLKARDLWVEPVVDTLSADSLAKIK